MVKIDAGKRTGSVSSFADLEKEKETERKTTHIYKQDTQ
jgi:hypothetical protein